MSNDPIIESVAREFASFSLDEADEEQVGTLGNYCQHAQLFHQWTEELLETYVRTGPTPTRLAQAKVFLTDRFMEWRALVPKSHRNRIGDNGHICVFHVFERGWQQIRTVELRLIPPLYLPPPAPRLPQIGGIMLGEVIGEDV